MFPPRQRFDLTEQSAGDLGQNSETTENTFNGLLDEVSLYNRALSASEIQAIYVAGSGGKCVTPVGPISFHNRLIRQ